MDIGGEEGVLVDVEGWMLFGILIRGSPACKGVSVVWGHSVFGWVSVGEHDGGGAYC